MTATERAVVSLRGMPGVDRLLRRPEIAAAAEQYSHAATVEVTREVLDALRAEARAGTPVPPGEVIAARIVAELDRAYGATLVPVINATGVIIHTNLGRAPLSRAAQAAMVEVAQGYSNLEFDLISGGRGSRHLHASELLRRLTGAEAAMVVNNAASALLLALSALARDREVIVSRGQAVEIGGGFRIPDVMRQSGATLVEVGTTNRTYAADYAGAVTERTALFLRVHSSNFKIVGFTHEVELPELAALGERLGVPVLDDLGSGALLDTARYGLAQEPMVQASVAAGAALVVCSGDKLLGGPQAGLIVGRREPVERLRRHPLARAVRVDKVTLAALQATLLHYLRGEAEGEVPIWRMIAAPLDSLGARAASWAQALADLGVPLAVEPGQSTVGGGSLPGETLPTRLLALDLTAAGGETELAARLRRSRPAVVGRVERGRLLLDPRTVLPEQDAALIGAVKQALG